MLQIKTPVHLNENSFEPLLSNFPSLKTPPSEISIDLSSTEFIDPYGMIGILELGQYLKNQGITPQLVLPGEEILSYMLRLEFFKFADSIFENKDFPSLDTSWHTESDVLLEITPVEKSGDIHEIIEKVRKRAKNILQRHLNYDKEDIENFIVALSEVCQNIPEHSQSKGLVGIQKYFYEKRLKSNAVKIAVMDSGIGFRESLKRKLTPIFKEKLSDEIAIKQALFEGVSRYDEPGRGHGLAKVRELVEKWKGKLTIRSGAAKLGMFPRWDIENPPQNPLTYFPGTQISAVLPAIPE